MARLERNGGVPDSIKLRTFLLDEAGTQASKPAALEVRREQAGHTTFSWQEKALLAHRRQKSDVNSRSNHEINTMFSDMLGHATVYEDDTMHDTEPFTSVVSDAEAAILMEKSIQVLGQAKAEWHTIAAGRGTPLYWREKTPGRTSYTDSPIGRSVKLSTNPDEHRRLLVFNNLRMAIVAPTGEDDGTIYKALFEEAGKIIFPEETRGVDSVGKLTKEGADSIFEGFRISPSIKVVADSSRYDDSGRIIVAAEEAIETAKIEAEIAKEIPAFRKEIEAEQTKRAFPGIVDRLNLQIDPEESLRTMQAERSAQAAAAAGSSNSNELDALNDKVLKIMTLRESMDDLASEGIGPRLTTGMGVRKIVYGLAIDVSAHTDTPTAVLITDKKVCVAQAGNGPDNAKTFKEYFDSPDGILPPWPKEALIPYSVGGVKLSSDKPGDLDRLAEYVAMVEKIIAEKRSANGMPIDKEYQELVASYGQEPGDTTSSPE